MDASALILAGGKATRFGGIAKHEIVVEGETIFARQVKVLAPRVQQILVSGAVVDGYRTVHDRVESAGPLAGIAAGLAACATDLLVVVAGDMPFISGVLVDDLLGRARVWDPHACDSLDVVGVRVNGFPEPLFCVLHKRVLPFVERMLAAGDYKVSRLLTDESLRQHLIDDVDPVAVQNLNSPEDLADIHRE